MDGVDQPLLVQAGHRAADIMTTDLELLDERFEVGAPALGLGFRERSKNMHGQRSDVHGSNPTQWLNECTVFGDDFRLPCRPVVLEQSYLASGGIAVEVSLDPRLQRLGFDDERDQRVLADYPKIHPPIQGRASSTGVTNSGQSHRMARS